jgi:AhpC/TSA family
MRPPVDHIAAPAFPLRLPWVNGEPLRIDEQLGRPVLIEFWDFCRPNSIRTLPYIRAWHEVYRPEGLRVIGVHAAGFEPSKDPEAVTAAVARLQIPYPVVVDVEHEIWQLYGNLGWPARYLFNPDGRLDYYHYGEGAYAETELAIRDLLAIDPMGATVAPIRPEDEPDAVLAPQTPDVEGPYSGPYEAGGVWAVLDGHGTVTTNGATQAVEHPGCYALIEHQHHTHGELSLTLSEGVTCHAVCFTPGLAPDAPAAA